MQNNKEMTLPIDLPTIEKLIINGLKYVNVEALCDDLRSIIDYLKENYE